MVHGISTILEKLIEEVLGTSSSFSPQLATQISAVVERSDPGYQQSLFQTLKSLQAKSASGTDLGAQVKSILGSFSKLSQHSASQENPGGKRVAEISGIDTVVDELFLQLMELASEASHHPSGNEITGKLGNVQDPSQQRPTPKHPTTAKSTSQSSSTPSQTPQNEIQSESPQKVGDESPQTLSSARPTADTARREHAQAMFDHSMLRDVEQKVHQIKQALDDVDKALHNLQRQRDELTAAKGPVLESRSSFNATAGPGQDGMPPREAEQAAHMNHQIAVLKENQSRLQLELQAYTERASQLRKAIQSGGNENQIELKAVVEGQSRDQPPRSDWPSQPPSGMVHRDGMQEILEGFFQKIEETPLKKGDAVGLEYRSDPQRGEKETAEKLSAGPPEEARRHEDNEKFDTRPPRRHDQYEYRNSRSYRQDRYSDQRGQRRSQGRATRPPRTVFTENSLKVKQQVNEYVDVANVFTKHKECLEEEIAQLKKSCAESEEVLETLKVKAEYLSKLSKEALESNAAELAIAKDRSKVQQAELDHLKNENEELRKSIQQMEFTHQVFLKTYLGYFEKNASAVQSIMEAWSPELDDLVAQLTHENHLTKLASMVKSIGRSQVPESEYPEWEKEMLEEIERAKAVTLRMKEIRDEVAEDAAKAPAVPTSPFTIENISALTRLADIKMKKVLNSLDAQFNSFAAMKELTRKFSGCLRTSLATPLEEQLMTAASQSTAERADLTETMNSLKSEIAQATQELHKLEKLVSSSKQDLANAQQEVSRAQAQKQQLEQEASSKSASIEAEIAQATAKLQEVNQNYGQTQRTLKTAQEELRVATEKAKEAEQQLQHLSEASEQMLLEQTKAKAALKALQDEMTVLETKAAALRMQASESTQDKSSPPDSTCAKPSGTPSAAKSQSSAPDQVAEVPSKTDTAQEDLERTTLISKVAAEKVKAEKELNMLTDQMKSLQQQINSAKSKCDELEHEKLALEKTMASLSSELENLRRQVTDAETQKTSLSSSLEAETTAISTLQEQISALHETSTAFKSQLSEAQSTAAAQENKLVTAQTRLSQLQAELDCGQNVSATLEQSMLTLQQSKSKKELELETLQRDSESVTQRLSEAESRANHLKEQLQETLVQLAGHKAMLAQYTEMALLAETEASKAIHQVDANSLFVSPPPNIADEENLPTKPNELMLPTVSQADDVSALLVQCLTLHQNAMSHAQHHFCDFPSDPSLAKTTLEQNILQPLSTLMTQLFSKAASTQQDIVTLASKNTSVEPQVYSQLHERPEIALPILQMYLLCSNAYAWYLSPLLESLHLKQMSTRVQEQLQAAESALETLAGTPDSSLVAVEVKAMDHLRKRLAEIEHKQSELIMREKMNIRLASKHSQVLLANAKAVCQRYVDRNQSLSLPVDPSKPPQAATPTTSDPEKDADSDESTRRNELLSRDLLEWAELTTGLRNLESKYLITKRSFQDFCRSEITTLPELEKLILNDELAPSCPSTSVTHGEPSDTKSPKADDLDVSAFGLEVEHVTTVIARVETLLDNLRALLENLLKHNFAQRIVAPSQTCPPRVYYIGDAPSTSTPTHKVDSELNVVSPSDSNSTTSETTTAENTHFVAVSGAETHAVYSSSPAAQTSTSGVSAKQHAIDSCKIQAEGTTRICARLLDGVTESFHRACYDALLDHRVAEPRRSGSGEMKLFSLKSLLGIFGASTSTNPRSTQSKDLTSTHKGSDTSVKLAQMSSSPDCAVHRASTFHSGSTHPNVISNDFNRRSYRGQALPLSNRYFIYMYGAFNSYRHSLARSKAPLCPSSATN